MTKFLQKHRGIILFSVFILCIVLAKVRQAYWPEDPLSTCTVVYQPSGDACIEDEELDATDTALYLVTGSNTVRVYDTAGIYQYSYEFDNDERDKIYLATREDLVYLLRSNCGLYIFRDREQVGYMTQSQYLESGYDEAWFEQPGRLALEDDMLQQYSADGVPMARIPLPQGVQPEQVYEVAPPEIAIPFLILFALAFLSIVMFCIVRAVKSHKKSPPVGGITPEKV